MQTRLTQISLHNFGYMTSANTKKWKKKRADSDQSADVQAVLVNTVGTRNEVLSQEPVI